MTTHPVVDTAGPWPLCPDCLQARETHAHSAKWRETREGETCEECDDPWPHAEGTA